MKLCKSFSSWCHSLQARRVLCPCLILFEHDDKRGYRKNCWGGRGRGGGGGWGGGDSTVEGGARFRNWVLYIAHFTSGEDVQFREIVCGGVHSQHVSGVAVH